MMTTPNSAPVIERFVLRGVNGYKTIELTCKTAAKILSAENGTGKTTIMNALYGVLSGQHRYLKNINFDSLSIKFSKEPELTVNKDDLGWFSSVDIASISDNQADYFHRYGLDDDEIHELVSIYNDSPTELDDNPSFHQFYMDSPYSRDQIISMLGEISEGMTRQTSGGGDFKTSVSSALAGFEVLYFPTYRRIETEIPEMGLLRRDTSRRRPFQEQRRRNLPLINFGLGDIEAQLESITNDIRRGTLEAYARISGKTLDQLLAGTHYAARSGEKYNIAAIKVVLGRLGKSKSQSENRIIELIESGGISSPEHDYLRYFLSQLVEIYKEKQLQESAVENFVKVINSYWPKSNNEKEFKFDKVSAEASIVNKITGEGLKLSALSSGEKQIVSTFAKLYLAFDKRYIVLIDEPELSLSMEWQKKFLPDILSSNSCSQLIAITHSPFIFENELDPYAGSLKVKISKKPRE